MLMKRIYPNWSTLRRALQFLPETSPTARKPELSTIIHAVKERFSSPAVNDL
jgi:hypothetical protein